MTNINSGYPTIAVEIPGGHNLQNTITEPLQMFVALKKS
jgi:hypothetical protein